MRVRVPSHQLRLGVAQLAERLTRRSQHVCPRLTKQLHRVRAEGDRLSQVRILYQHCPRALLSTVDPTVTTTSALIFENTRGPADRMRLVILHVDEPRSQLTRPQGHVAPS